jgi:hypothetical protein
VGVFENDWSNIMNDLTTKQQDWNDTLEVLKGLYPRWEVTSQQLKAWKEQFGMCNQEWLQEACTLMYRQWTGENPKPKWLSWAFRQIRAGHQGVPVDESGKASAHNKKEKEEWERHVLQCDLERAHHWKTMQDMDAEERTNWAQSFVNKHPALGGRNDAADMETWSKTFCSFVCAHRNMQGAT